MEAISTGTNKQPYIQDYVLTRFGAFYLACVLQSGTSNMPGMTSFKFKSDLDRNDWRGFADVEHQFMFTPTHTLAG
jgi:hypothetical protein